MRRCWGSGSLKRSGNSLSGCREQNWSSQFENSSYADLRKTGRRLPAKAICTRVQIAGVGGWPSLVEIRAEIKNDVVRGRSLICYSQQWLSHQDSNLKTEIQNLVCYHYTMGQNWGDRRESNPQSPDSQSGVSTIPPRPPFYSSTHLVTKKPASFQKRAQCKLLFYQFSIQPVDLRDVGTPRETRTRIVAVKT